MSSDILESAELFPVTTRQVGDIRIDAIIDTEMRWDAASIFETRPAPYPLDELPSRLPREFDGAGWRYLARVFLIRSPEATVLVDAGIGPSRMPEAQFVGAGGQLPRQLAALGVELGDIDHLVLTHLHDDHVGWSMSEDGAPLFPNARYHLHPADIEMARSRTKGDGPLYWREVFAPLLASDHLVLGEGDTELAPGIRIQQANGHTPGHQCVRVEGDGELVLVIGDLAHFSYQLTDPSLSGPFDRWPDAAAAARARILAEASTRPVTLASAHLPDAFTPIG